MVPLQPDPTFSPSPRMAMEAREEDLVHVVMFDSAGARPDGLATVELADGGKLAGVTEVPAVGDELHHFGFTTSAISSTRSRQAATPRRDRSTHSAPGRARPAAQRWATDGRALAGRPTCLFRQLAVGAWDQQFYPEGIDSWMVKIDADEQGIVLDPGFFVDIAAEEAAVRARSPYEAATPRRYCFLTTSRRWWRTASHVE